MMQIIIENSATSVAFKTGSKSAVFGFWERYLAINGKNVYKIGVACSTCPYLFERVAELDSANYAKIMEQAHIINSKFNAGITTVEQELVDSLKIVMPKGRYSVFLTRIIPKLVYPGDSNDYFANEQFKFLDLDCPYNPRTEYYLGHKVQEFSYKENLFEFIVPLFSSKLLNSERIEYYKHILLSGKMPTAVSLGILDVICSERGLRNYEDTSVLAHACFAQYLIDGHHKLYAAALAQKPLTILTFLAHEQGLSDDYDIDLCIKALQF